MIALGMRYWIAFAALTFAACATSETPMKECGPGECAATASPYSPDETALRKRGAFDLHCDNGQLRVVPFDSRSYGVEGCGRRITYSNSCPDRDRQDPSNEGRCTWVRSGESTPASPPSAH